MNTNTQKEVVATEVDNTNEFNPMQSITIKEFSAMWKMASNDKRRLPSFKEEKCRGYNHQTNNYETFMQKVKVKGFLHPEHHILYNLVRGLPLTRGFKEGSDGYFSALSFFTSEYHSEYWTEKLYEPFKEAMIFEKFKALIAEARVIAKSKE